MSATRAAAQAVLALCALCALGQDGTSAPEESAGGPQNATARATLAWPQIPEGEIQLEDVGWGTRLRWTAALWIPAVARDDLPLHIYEFQSRDLADLPYSSGPPLFKVTEAGGLYTATKITQPPEEIDEAGAGVQLIASPLMLPDRDEIDIKNVDLSRLRPSVASSREVERE